MKKFVKLAGVCLLILASVLVFAHCGFADDEAPLDETPLGEAPLDETPIGETPLDETPLQEPDGAQTQTYTSAEDVAAYIHENGCLPDNFITKKEARELGWEGGGLEPYAPGMCIGGDKFGNYEKLLPEAEGRQYYECDIDTLGAEKRGAKRLIYSNDGLIYYTEDHYESFTLLYGDE